MGGMGGGQMQQQQPAVQQQQASASLDGQIVSQGWPPTTGFVGQRIRSLELTVGNVRNDVMVAKTMVGRLIGTGGSMYKELQTKTGAQIFILDKEGPPPGQADDRQPSGLAATKTPFWAIKRPTHPSKSAIQNLFTVGNAKGA